MVNNSLMIEKDVSSQANKTLVLTPMTLADVEFVADIEQRSFSAPWSAGTFRHELEHNGRSVYWVIRPAQPQPNIDLPPILAYGGYWLLGHEAHIMTIATHPEWRRHQLGEWMLLEMLARARASGVQQATLEVRASNRTAISLYTKTGFVEVGLRKRYYRDNNEDALLLTLFRLDSEAVWQPLYQRLVELQSKAFTVVHPSLDRPAQ
jgi:[ribosomal protein S18]-alanine N-acetyltransferase